LNRIVFFSGESPITITNLVIDVILTNGIFCISNFVFYWAVLFLHLLLYHYLHSHCTNDLCFIAAATRFIQEGSTTTAGQIPTVVALNFNKPPPLSVCPQTCAVTESVVSSAQSLTSPRPGILRKRAHGATLVT